MKYGMKDYKELLEKAIRDYDDPMQCPFGMDPFTEGARWRAAKQEALNYAIEMMPEFEESK